MSHETLTGSIHNFRNKINSSEKHADQLLAVPVDAAYCICLAAEHLLSRPVWDVGEKSDASKYSVSGVISDLREQYSEELADKALIMGIVVAQINGSLAEFYLRSYSRSPDSIEGSGTTDDYIRECLNHGNAD